jgi:uncharacterized protein YcfL
MRTVSLILASLILLAGCSADRADSRVQLGEGVGEANLTTNPIVAPFARAVSDLIGQGLVVENVVESTTPDGFYKIDVTVRNNSWRTKRFQYRFDWLETSGALVSTKTSVWTPFSLSGNSTATIQGIAPRQNARNFRVTTRDQF